MFRYTLRKENVCGPDAGDYTTFGIVALEEVNSDWVDCAFVSDVSTDYNAVFELVQRCNEQQLQPIHLLDVIADYLNA